MGFQLGRPINLVFEGALEGAVIKLRPTSVSLYLRLGEELTFNQLAELLVENIIEWNLEGFDGEPLPITAEAILSNMEKLVIEKVHFEWLRAAGGVSAPLEQPSKDGDEPSKDEETNQSSPGSSKMLIPQEPLYPQEN